MRALTTIRAALMLGAAVGSGCNGIEDTEPVKGAQAVTPAAERPASTLALAPDLDVHRSLIVTDTAILEPTFSFKRVMDQIVALGGGRVGSLALFNRWWDTQNPGPGLTPHCDDQKTGGLPSHNGFPWACPRAEGAQVKTDPFTPATGNPEGYTAIALTNRFDLAPRDGSHCGEYRIVFAKNSGVDSPTNRNLVIFEAVLPNPRRSCGLEGCRAVAEFWAQLSQVESVKERAALLEAFYFKGLPGFRPVVHPDHYGARLVGHGYAASGQIRSNEFMQSPWMLREWRLVNDCRCGRCTPVMSPTTVKVNPWGALFDETSSEPRADQFQEAFLGQVASLAVPDINGFFNDVEDRFNAGQSLAQGNENRYLTHFDAGRMVDPAFHDAVAARLASIGSPLTPGQIVQRATAMSCAGCHQLSNNQDLGGGLTWPASATFVHVAENGGPSEAGPDGPRWRISPALRNVFLPFRKKVLEGFLASAQGRVCGPQTTPPEQQVDLVPSGLPITCRGDEPSRPVSQEEITILETDKPSAPPLGGRTVH